MKKAIVVGAGLAGLASAYKLQQAGWNVMVLEAGAYAGGRAASVEVGGYTIDTAATQITSGYKDYLALCDELGLRDSLYKCKPLAGILRDGVIHELDASKLLSGPLSPIVSWRSKLVMLKTIVDRYAIKPPLNYLDIGASAAYDDESLADYSRRRLNQELHDYLVTPMLRANYLHCPDEATKLEWFAMMENFAGQDMLAMRGGIQRLPQFLAGLLDVRLNAPAQAIALDGDHVVVTWRKDGVEQRDDVDACVIATRLPEAIALHPPYADIAGEFGRRMRYSRGTLVHLGYRKQTESKVIGVFISKKEHPQLSLVWMEHNKLPELAPPGHSLITCNFDDACADDCYNFADEDVIRIGNDFLMQLFPELEGSLDVARVSRWPMAIPVPKPGTYTEAHKLKQRIDPAGRIQYAGDYFTCVGQNSAIHYGKLAAANLAKHHG